MRTSNARTGKMPGGLGDFILPLSHDSMRNASAITADHAVPCQIQKPFPMMPLDVRAHLPVELVENFRADELVYDIHSRLNIIPETVLRHVPSTVTGLLKLPYDHAVKENMAFVRPVLDRAAVVADSRLDV